MTLKAKFFFCIKLKQNKTFSQVQTELIHLFLLLFPFSATGGPAEERLLVSQINSCVVSEALARQPETNPNTPASGLMLCFCGSHGGPDTQIHHWSSHLWRLWSGILLKGTKPKLGMEPPIFQTVTHQLYLKEPRSECFGKREKENSQISHNYRLNVTAADYVSSCLSHYLLFVSSVSISLQTQSRVIYARPARNWVTAGAFSIKMKATWFIWHAAPLGGHLNMRRQGIMSGHLHCSLAKWKSSGVSLGCNARFLSPWQG